MKDTGQWAALRDEFVEAQDGKCAICRRPIKDRPRLDHCHATGFIRGVLCNSCNIKLGWYEKRRAEIESYLARAGEYAAYLATPRRAKSAGL